MPLTPVAMLLTVSSEVDGRCESDESDIVGDFATSVVVRMAHDFFVQEVLRWLRRAELKSRVGNFTV